MQYNKLINSYKSYYHVNNNIPASDVFGGCRFTNIYFRNFFVRYKGKRA